VINNNITVKTDVEADLDLFNGDLIDNLNI
jgi:hypothetical protein